MQIIYSHPAFWPVSVDFWAVSSAIFGTRTGAAAGDVECCFALEKPEITPNKAESPKPEEWRAPE